MQRQVLLTRPGVLDGRRIRQIRQLMSHAMLAHAVQCLIVVQASDLFAVRRPEVPDRREPLVDDAGCATLHGCIDATAALMAADDDVVYLQGLDGVLDHAHAAGVIWLDKVCNISVNENVARKLVSDHRFRHAAV